MQVLVFLYFHCLPLASLPRHLKSEVTARGHSVREGVRKLSHEIRSSQNTAINHPNKLSRLNASHLSASALKVFGLVQIYVHHSVKEPSSGKLLVRSRGIDGIRSQTHNLMQQGRQRCRVQPNQAKARHLQSCGEAKPLRPRPCMPG